MKITKTRLKEIIKEEIENALEESGYDRRRDHQLTHGGSRYKQKERHRAIRRQQMKDSTAAEKLGREDAIAGREENPDQLDSYKSLYSKAYQDAKANKKEDMQETDVEEGKFRDMFRGKKPSASPESDEAAQYMRKLKQTKRGKEAASVSVKQTGRDMSRNLAKVGGKSRFEEDTE